MIKKLYSLFSILLLLASCATEEIEQIEIQPTDGSMVSLSMVVFTTDYYSIFYR